MKRKVTIQDIAAAVGCSKTTVSRYINGQTNMMSAETAERIRNVIELLDYHPSELARSLKTKKTYVIGIVLSDIASAFASSVVTGAGEVLEKSGYVPLFVNSHEDPARERKAIASLVSKGVDGLIVNTTSPENDFLYGYQMQGIPIVLCDRRLHNYNLDIVSENKDEIITALIAHLKEQGYTRIASFAQSHPIKIVRDFRRNRFLKIAEEQFGYDARNNVYEIAEDSVAFAAECVKKYMASLREGDIPAIVGENSVITMLAYRAIKNLGYSMPEDIGLCGGSAWDWNEGLTWMDMLRPRVSCVTIHGYEIGKKCANLILDKIDHPGGPAKEVWIGTSFKPKESSIRKKAAKE